MAKEVRARGWEAGDGDPGQGMGQVRRSISVEVMRAQLLVLGQLEEEKVVGCVRRSPGGPPRAQKSRQSFC